MEKFCSNRFLPLIWRLLLLFCLCVCLFVCAGGRCWNQLHQLHRRHGHRQQPHHQCQQHHHWQEQLWQERHLQLHPVPTGPGCGPALWLVTMTALIGSPHWTHWTHWTEPGCSFWEFKKWSVDFTWRARTYPCSQQGAYIHLGYGCLMDWGGVKAALVFWVNVGRCRGNPEVLVCCTRCNVS